MNFLGFVVALEGIQDRAQRGEVARDVGMAGSQSPLAEGDTPASETFGARVPAAHVLEASEVVIEGRERRVTEIAWPTDAQPAQVGARRVPVPALALVDDAEVVEQGRLQHRMRSIRPREQAEGIQEQCFGPVVAEGAPLAIGPSSQPKRAKGEPGAQRRSGSFLGLRCGQVSGATRPEGPLSEEAPNSRRRAQPLLEARAVSPFGPVWRLPR